MQLSGLAPTQASQMHREKINLSEDFTHIANNATNPSHEAVKYLRRKWTRAEMGGFDSKSITESLDSYASQHPELTLK